MKLSLILIILAFMIFGYVFGRYIFEAPVKLKPIPSIIWVVPTSTPQIGTGIYTIPPATNPVPPK